MIKQNATFSTNEKKAVLLLHGYLADKNSFIYQINDLAKNFNVYAIDLKGFGENKEMDFPYSLSDYVLDVKNFIINNGIVCPHIIAHSFGGRIALKLCAENPNLVDKIVLTGCAGLKPKRTLKYRVKVGVFKVLSKFVPKNRLKKFYSEDYKNLSPVMQESFKKIVCEHLDDLLSRIKNPALIIHGKKDKETPPYMAKRLNNGIVNSKLIFIEDAGHFAFIDKPLKFNMEVREFLLSK